MEVFEIGDLIFSTKDVMFMVVQQFDYSQGMLEGNFGYTEADADLRSSGHTIWWGRVRAKDARKVHRLKDLPPAEKICTCTTLDLFRAGCKCGAVTPYKQVY